MGNYSIDGYTVVRNAISLGAIDRLRCDVSSMISASLSLTGMSCFSPFDDGLMQLRAGNPSTAIAIYQATARLLSLAAIVSEVRVNELAESLLSTRNLLISASSLRYDPPNADDLLIGWHQDYPYIQDSEHSAVFWFPLRSMFEGSGGVELIPGSHLNGIHRVKTDSVFGKDHVRWIEPVLKFDGERTVQPLLAAGDLLIMHTFLVHRSSPNRSNEVRWTGQFRVGDFMHINSIARQWPAGMVGGVDFGIHHPELIEVTK